MPCKCKDKADEQQLVELDGLKCLSSGSSLKDLNFNHHCMFEMSSVLYYSIV